MAEPNSLLPDPTLWERALSLTGAGRRPLDTSLLSDILDPWRCPADMLPFLAYSWSVDLWDERWPEAKKRQVIAASPRHHRMKTTLSGIRAHLAIVDCKLLKAERPPARPHLVSTMTEAERANWLASLPQIRIFPFANKEHTGGHRGFLSGPGGRRHLSRFHSLASRGPVLYGRRAVFVRDGIETPVRIASDATQGAIATDRLFLTGAARKRAFLGHAHFGRFPIADSTAAENVVTVRLTGSAQPFAVGRGMRAVDVRPARIATRRIAPRGRWLLGGGHLGRGSHVTGSHAPLLIYDRIALHDTARTSLRRHAHSFLGHMRLGIDPCSADLTVSVPMRRPRRRFAVGGPLRGYLKPADMAPLQRALSAIRVSKAFRDTIRVNTTTHRTVRLRDSLRLGTFKLGELRRVV